MQRSIALRLTAAVWVANVGVAALAVACLNHTKPYSEPADSWRPSSETAAKQVASLPVEAEPQIEDQGAVIVMPMVTIIGRRPGNAMMQGAAHVTIGPGTVTHPASIPPRRAR